MKTQIVYALIATPEDTYLQEFWASLYSLRLYEPDREVIVCCDRETANYANNFPQLVNLLTEIIVVPVPEKYNNKQRSREIKTTIREHVSGNYLFVDTDTIFAGTLDGIDSWSYDIAAVQEYHVPFSNSLFRDSVIQRVKRIFDIDISKVERYYNSGVMFVADTPFTHSFYQQWHSNWLYSTFTKGNEQDQPSLVKTDMEMGFVIQDLPGEYNCMMALSVDHFFEAKIIHYLHFDLLPKPQNPFLNKSIYHKIKEDGKISETTAYTIHHCKAAFITPSCIIDGETVEFLLSNPGHVFINVFKRGGRMLSMMNKIAALFAKILKYKGVRIW
jgi:hypothetical protein